MKVECRISLGELIDKISILKVKKINISDSMKLEFVENELKMLLETLEQLSLDKVDEYISQLVDVNSILWKIEDEIRDKELDQAFDQAFIDLARSVYRSNDRRFAIKNKINEVYGSTIREVKSYKKYE